MTAPAMTVTVDRTDLDRYLADGKHAIAELVDELAKELDERLREESAGASKRVAASWEVEPGPSADERRVVSDVFFAAFLARGTAGHGPTKARAMTFEIKGDFVRAAFVAGIPANPFHERAIDATEAAASGIVEQLIAGLA